MNRSELNPVERRGATARAVWLLLISLIWTACVDIGGGAVELSWTLRTPDGEPNQCGRASIDNVRLCWKANDEPGQTCDGQASFDCEEQRGFSRFEVAPGATRLWIEPLCEDTLVVPDPATYEVPAPVVRQVETGEVVTLNALLIIATDNAGGCRTNCTCR